jgi:hypothetical protein
MPLYDDFKYSSESLTYDLNSQSNEGTAQTNVVSTPKNHRYFQKTFRPEFKTSPQFNFAKPLSELNIYEIELILANYYRVLLPLGRCPYKTKLFMDNDNPQGLLSRAIENFASNSPNKNKPVSDMMAKVNALGWSASRLATKFMPALVATYFVGDTDFNPGNYGINLQNEIVRIDFGRSLPTVTEYYLEDNIWQNNIISKSFNDFNLPITADAIIRFPNRPYKNGIAEWPYLDNANPLFCQHKLPFPNENEQSYSDLMREKYKYFLKCLLLGSLEGFTEQFVNYFLQNRSKNVPAEIVIKALQNRQRMLLSVFTTIPEFVYFYVCDREKYTIFNEILSEFSAYNEFVRKYLGLQISLNELITIHQNLYSQNDKLALFTDFYNSFKKCQGLIRVFTKQEIPNPPICFRSISRLKAIYTLAKLTSVDRSKNNLKQLMLTEYKANLNKLIASQEFYFIA